MASASRPNSGASATSASAATATSNRRFSICCHLPSGRRVRVRPLRSPTCATSARSRPAQRAGQGQMHLDRLLHQRFKAGLDQVGARPGQGDEHVVGAMQPKGGDGEREIFEEERFRLAQREAADDAGAAASASGSERLSSSISCSKPTTAMRRGAARPRAVEARQRIGDRAAGEHEAGEPEPDRTPRGRRGENRRWRGWRRRASAPPARRRSTTGTRA